MSRTNLDGLSRSLFKFYSGNFILVLENLLLLTPVVAGLFGDSAKFYVVGVDVPDLINNLLLMDDYFPALTARP